MLHLIWLVFNLQTFIPCLHILFLLESAERGTWLEVGQDENNRGDLFGVTTRVGELTQILFGSPGRFPCASGCTCGTTLTISTPFNMMSIVLHCSILVPTVTVNTASMPR